MGVRVSERLVAVVMDTFSRKIIGWSIDNAQDSTLVVNALDMAIKNRQPSAGGIVHADHGVQFISSAFTNKIRTCRAYALRRNNRRLLRQLD